MSTRALAFLKQHRIAHEAIKYTHDEKGAQFAAQAVGFPLPRTIKTLVVDLGNGSHALALIPGDRQLSLKKIAAVRGTKKATMADAATAERLTGYLVGGISPFGTRQQLPVVMESCLQAYAAVMINGGQRGLMVKLTPGDIVRHLNAQLADIAR